ncbi:hypothetical protein Plo01_28630 [Planobispora longispora]|uniref:Uncharacterized protein n=1 Tax=Planobispora longispora TaxID=28887 RepID=A0A8J3RMP4_9ACTN|nr:hypothetical protein Plo01_28630 [Planobispora longispora]
MWTEPRPLHVIDRVIHEFVADARAACPKELATDVSFSPSGGRLNYEDPVRSRGPARLKPYVGILQVRELPARRLMSA